MEVSLKEHLESRVAALEDSFDREFNAVRTEIKSIKNELDSNKEFTNIKFQMTQVAIDKAEKAQELRNEAQNEWRNQFKDQTGSFTTKTDVYGIKGELSGRADRNEADIRVLRSELPNYFTRAEHEAFLRRTEEDVKALQLNQATLAGKASQSDVNSLRIISYIGLALGIVGLLITVIKMIAI